jgi:hypothetical protein
LVFGYLSGRHAALAATSQPIARVGDSQEEHDD